MCVYIFPLSRHGHLAVCQTSHSCHTHMTLGVHGVSGFLKLCYNNITASLDSNDAVAHRVPVVVQDRGNPSLSLTILVIIDIQVPVLVLVDDTQCDEY